MIKLNSVGKGLKKPTSLYDAEKKVALYKKLVPGTHVWLRHVVMGRSAKRRRGYVSEVYDHYVLIQLEHWKTCVKAGSLISGDVIIEIAKKGG